MEIRINIQVEHWPISRLIPRITNPRTHTPEQVAQIAASMREWGWTNPILVGAENDVLAGHARLLAARQLGMTEVPVIPLGPLSEAQRRALVSSDDQRSITGASWNEETLRIELQALGEAEFDLSLVGFDDEELARLLAAEEATTDLTDEDDVPDVMEAPVTRPGEIWHLGPISGGGHRVMCGNSTDQEQVARLMNGEQAGMIFCDPPYSCNLASTQNIPSRHRDDGAFIANDDLDFDAFVPFLRQAFALLAMPDGRTASIPGRGEYLLKLFVVAARGANISAEQAAELDMIRRSTDAIEPAGGRMVELIRCFLRGSAKEGA